MYVLRAIRSNPVRPVLTILQIVLASFAITVSLSAYLTPENTLAEDTFYLIAGYQDGHGSAQMYNLFRPLDVRLLAQLAPDVESLGVLEYAYYPEFVYDSRRYQFQNGATVSPQYLLIEEMEITEGGAFSTAEAKTEEAVVLMSESAAAIIFGDAEPLGQEILEVSSTGGAPTPYRVIGTFPDATAEASSAPAVYFPVWAPSATHSIVGPFAASQLIVRAKPGRSEEAGAQLLVAARRQYRDHPQLAGIEPGRDFYLTEQNDLIELSPQLNPNLIILGLFGIMTLIIGSIGVFSNSIVSVVERRHEIGLKRALGATGGAIGRDFAVETLLLAHVGSLIGAALAAAAIPPLLERLRDTFFGPTLSWQPAAALIAVGVTAVLSATLGIWPAYRAGRLIPLANLRD